MSASKGTTSEGASGRGSAMRGPCGSRLPLVFFGMLVVGTAVTLASDVRWVEAVANHVGALGVVGLLACLAAYVAKKKGRDARTAFLLAGLLPIALGIIAVILVYFTTGFVYCGGGVILLSAMIVIVGYCCLWKRATSHA